MSTRDELGEAAVDEWVKRLHGFPWDLYGVLTFARAPLALSHEDTRVRAASRVAERFYVGRGLPPIEERYRAAMLERAQGAWQFLASKMARTRFRRWCSTPDAFPWARVIEKHADGQFHIHFVVAAPSGVAPFRPQEVLSVWVGPDTIRPLFGRARVEPFDPSRAKRGLRYAFKQSGTTGFPLVSRAAANLIFTDPQPPLAAPPGRERRLPR
jgi:hypothetical protein